MNNFRHDLAVRSVKLINSLLMAAPFVVCWFACYAARMSGPLYSWGNLVMLLLFLFLYISFGKVYDGFLVSINRISEMVYSQVLALFLSDFLSFCKSAAAACRPCCTGGRLVGLVLSGA